MIIKKFKNGSINLRLQSEDIENGVVNEDVYHDEMFMEDLYLHCDDGGTNYLIDYNTQRAYYLGGYLLQNPLKELLEILKTTYTRKITWKLYPMTDKTMEKEIFQEILDNEE